MINPKQFKTYNLAIGWFTFIIALVTYTLTVEPTVSFWDAGEYILTSSKLQVGHPPGAPLFQMLGAMFSMFALDPSQIGFVMNMMSATSSAFAILFMFWTIVLILKRLTKHNEKDAFSASETIIYLGSAFVGSLAFAFTDTFWFNAAETEVYAMATLIMTIMFYLGLKWEKEMHLPNGNRWLILIAFIIGLSFGVHFMGLLTIPAIGLIYYFKNYKTITVKNFIVANLASVAVLLFVFKLMFPNVLRYFSTLELFFVNQMGLPFNSGTVIAGILLIAAFYYGISYTRKKELYNANTAILCLLFVMIGSSTWLMLPIRANAKVVINENNPSSARELLAYYNLEQYPETHLFYGPMFTDQYSGLDEDKPYIDDKPKYEKDEKTGTYIIVNDYKDAKQNYNSKHAAILPRMWSAEHAERYMTFTGPLDFKLKPEYYMENELRSAIKGFRESVNKGEVDSEDYNKFLKQFGQYIDVEKPSLFDNISYMFDYQLGYMYVRYFMWNFTGRQDDIQGRMDNHGNWISGINFIDEMRLGLSQDNLPSDAANNKGRNTYYFLPFILGLIGFLFVYNNDKKRFWVMLVFFLFTGVAIQVYTNVRPFEPRERDYSVVGSFYVFALWIGIGVYALFDFAKKYISPQLAATAVPVITFLLVPLLLATNNWDDHDRSDKYTALAMAKKYLSSCDQNAILFSIGDNDTFPLWYAQEIENFRKDVRVVNTSLFQTDWYIDQMKSKAYDSDPIPSQLTHDKYKHGTRDYIMRRLRTRDTMNIKQFVSFISSDNPRTKLSFALTQEGENPSSYPKGLSKANFYPTSNISIPVNKTTVLENKIVDPKDADKIEDELIINIKESGIYKNRLLMLDVIANNDWKRPIYFTGGAFSDEDYIWMKDYLQLDGMVYKLVPIKTAVDKANPYDMGRIDSEKAYNMITSWDWGNSGSSDIYHDIETRRNSITYRGNLARVMEQLINEKQLKKAEKIADIAMKNMPVDKFEYYTLLEPFIYGYYETGATEKARQLFKQLANKYQENLKYYSEQDIDLQEDYFTEILTSIERYKALVEVVVTNDKSDFSEKEFESFNNYLRLFSHFYRGNEDIDRRKEENTKSEKDTIEKIIKN